MTTLLKDLIDIPERAGEEDYVLRLTDSIGSSDAVTQTLDQYVVTQDLAASFDQALGLVSEAIRSDVSRGAFLAGSFGSGKSHFMAVLHALLTQDPTARAKTELQPVITRHDPELRDKKILPLAFHLLGAESMEQAIFDGYLRQIKALPPDAPLPAVHESDGLLVDAERLRTTLGDEQFFATLNDDGADDEWGAVLGSGTWDRERYDRARAATPDTELRQQLVTVLVEKHFSSFARQAGYIDLDSGLAAIATHARGLGYDAVVLFLDELVLWLAFSVGDQSFFRRESQKLTKLVESSTGKRAIPLISFVARQMDLRRWFADSGASGAEQEALDRAFRHQEGRFATIQLGDDNLPYVAHRRLLRPKDDQAAQIIEEAFDHLERRPEVWDVLLDGINTDEQHRGADEKAFRLTYPFSPALISTLRSLASVMQRERTALKVMQQMLVDRRETLAVDDVIPVGDAFEYIVNGQDALDNTAAALFRSARTLYVEKFRPLLLSTHGLSEDDLTSGAELPTAYRADDRLAKTLLLSAVAPKVPALRKLTASRLASLNHGSIVSPIAGNERAVVAAKLRDWRRQIPELHVDDDHRDPEVRVQLEDVDYESVVEKAKGEDNPGRRRELVKRLIAELLGIDLGPADMLGAHTHEVVWRGSRREVDLTFGNVRDSSWLTEDHFAARPGTWRLVIDHPFDEDGHSSAEDIARVDRLLATGQPQRTLVWLPMFLSADKMRDLRRLVILDWLFEGTGERWASHADHLSETDRATARAILEGHHRSLRDSLMRALEQAYGIVRPAPGILLDEAGSERVLTSLDRSFDPGSPRGSSFASAFADLIDRAFSATYPAHPRFEPGDVEVTLKELRQVRDHLVRAVEHPDKRVPLEGDVASVRRVANALGVGHAAENAFIFGDDRFTWGSELAKALGREGKAEATSISVADMRRWIDAIEPAHGLRPEVSDLIIIAWALLRQTAWYQHGAPIDPPDPGKVLPTMELRRLPLPTQTEWEDAVAAAGTLFGINEARFLTPPRFASLTQQVREKATSLAPTARALVEQLERAYSSLGISTDVEVRSRDRLSTARTAAELLQTLRQLDGIELVRRLGQVNGTRDALGASMSQADTVVTALERFRWERLEPLKASTDTEARAILESLGRAITADQIVIRAESALTEAEDATFRWATAQRPVTPPLTPADSPAGRPTADDVDLDLPGTRGGSRRVARGSSPDRVLDELRSFLQTHQQQDVEVWWRVVE